MSFVKKEFLLLLKNKKLSISIYSLIGIEFILHIIGHFWNWRDVFFISLINDVIRYTIVLGMLYVLIMSGWRAYKSTSLYDDGEESELYNIIYYGVLILVAITIMSISITRC